MAKVDFRAAVVAVVRRGDGKVLVFERKGQPGAWQFPQGGMDRGETPVEAVWRELEEETGLRSKHVRIRGEHPRWVTYEWPPDIGDGRRLGQTQRWFAFDVRKDSVEPTPDGVEFAAWRWVSTKWILRKVVAWRRPPYVQVLGDGPTAGFGRLRHR